jgi:hypothetical protein
MGNSAGKKTVSDMDYFRQNIAARIVTPRLMELGPGMRAGPAEVNSKEILAFVISEWGFAPRTRVVLN